MYPGWGRGCGQERGSALLGAGATLCSLPWAPAGGQGSPRHCGVGCRQEMPWGCWGFLARRSYAAKLGSPEPEPSLCPARPIHHEWGQLGSQQGPARCVRLGAPSEAKPFYPCSPPPTPVLCVSVKETFSGHECTAMSVLVNLVGSRDPLGM